jgi:hypothetical protein
LKLYVANTKHSFFLTIFESSFSLIFYIHQQVMTVLLCVKPICTPISPFASTSPSLSTPTFVSRYPCTFQAPRYCSILFLFLLPTKNVFLSTSYCLAISFSSPIVSVIFLSLSLTQGSHVSPSFCVLQYTYNVHHLWQLQNSSGCPYFKRKYVQFGIPKNFLIVSIEGYH